MTFSLTQLLHYSSLGSALLLLGCLGCPAQEIHWHE
ncbi:hypothetical protein CJA_2339 [Cellvibrio japonicus Ueda107]|uniref:Uncharacterized protein n=1 Tax=Cellvibrio japonicus (strain Ueda107) TaxID=498211 RepID=B3PJX7_CELJU|nr:hypothetical protein CJA_2339 [Cellvibrio japonicus Ueda107]